MKDKDIQKKIKQGAILAQVSFEVIGNPKEHVTRTIHGYVNNIKNDSRISVLSEEFGEPEKIEGGLWSTFVDTEMLVEGLDRFTWMCINFMPANIDIIAPENLKFREKDLTNWLNDLLAKLHEISHTVRDTNIKNKALSQGMNALIQNSLLLAAENYHSKNEIGRKMGIPVKQLEPFFKSLKERGRLEEKKGRYYKQDKKES